MLWTDKAKRYLKKYWKIDELKDKQIDVINELLLGNDVILNINLSLLEALKGCNKSVKTIDGDKEIVIPSMTKNKDEIILPKLGVGRQGNQKTIVNIQYPSKENIDKIIEILGEE